MLPTIMRPPPFSYPHHVLRIYPSFFHTHTYRETTEFMRNSLQVLPPPLLSRYHAYRFGTRILLPPLSTPIRTSHLYNGGRFVGDHPANLNPTHNRGAALAPPPTHPAILMPPRTGTLTSNPTPNPLLPHLPPPSRAVLLLTLPAPSVTPDTRATPSLRVLGVSDGCIVVVFGPG